MVEEHVVLNIDTYEELIDSRDNWNDAKERIEELEQENTALEHLAIECAIDRVKLGSQTLEQCLQFDSEAWSVIKPDNLKRIKDMGIMDSTIEYVVKCEYYNEHPSEKPLGNVFVEILNNLGGKSDD